MYMKKYFTGSYTLLIVTIKLHAKFILWTICNFKGHYYSITYGSHNGESIGSTRLFSPALGAQPEEDLLWVPQASQAQVILVVTPQTRD